MESKYSAETKTMTISYNLPVATTASVASNGVWDFTGVTTPLVRQSNELGANSSPCGSPWKYNEPFLCQRWAELEVDVFGVL